MFSTGRRGAHECWPPRAVRSGSGQLAGDRGAGAGAPDTTALGRRDTEHGDGVSPRAVYEVPGFKTINTNPPCFTYRQQKGRQERQETHLQQTSTHEPQQSKCTGWHPLTETRRPTRRNYNVSRHQEKPYPWDGGDDVKVTIALDLSVDSNPTKIPPGGGACATETERRGRPTFPAASEMGAEGTKSPEWGRRP